MVKVTVYACTQLPNNLTSTRVPSYTHPQHNLMSTRLTAHIYTYTYNTRLYVYSATYVYACTQLPSNLTSTLVPSYTHPKHNLIPRGI